MKLSISNIAWEPEYDGQVYELMKQYGFQGLEIAPTRIFKENPYDDLDKAGQWQENLFTQYGIVISSMQSIWYGRKEQIFGGQEERAVLSDYTRQAIDFAETIKCHNLVFGCPKNRNVPDGAASDPVAVPFFRGLGEYAIQKGTVIGMEANPPIYGTNYINSTEAALDLIRKVDSAGFKLNLDVGTMLQNGESIDMLEGKILQINHVHISEPGLKIIEARKLHKELADYLETCGYDGFVSVEMGKQDNIGAIESVMEYVREIFV